MAGWYVHKEKECNEEYSNTQLANQYAVDFTNKCCKTPFIM